MFISALFEQRNTGRINKKAINVAICGRGPGGRNRVGGDSCVGDFSHTRHVDIQIYNF